MVIENIYKFIAFKELKVSEFAKICGFSNGYLAKQKAKKGDVGSSKIERMVKEFPELNTEWLLKGEGNMLRNPNQDNLLAEDAAQYGSKQPQYVDDLEKFFYAAPALPGRSLYDKQRLLTISGSIKGVPSLPSIDSLLSVVGYAMQPLVPEGSIIGVKKISDLNSLKIKYKYLIITPEDCMIRFVEPHTDDKNALWCTAPEEDSFKLEKSNIIELHRIMAVMLL